MPLDCYDTDPLLLMGPKEGDEDSAPTVFPYQRAFLEAMSFAPRHEFNFERSLTQRYPTILGLDFGSIERSVIAHLTPEGLQIIDDTSTMSFDDLQEAIVSMRRRMFADLSPAEATPLRAQDEDLDFARLDTSSGGRHYEMASPEVGRARAIELADFIETLDDDQFDLGVWQEPRHGRHAFGRADIVHAKDLTCCNGGWAEYLFAGIVDPNSTFQIGALLGMDEAQRALAFCPALYLEEQVYNRSQSAAMLRHYGATGEVDWRAAGFKSAAGAPF